MRNWYIEIPRLMLPILRLIKTEPLLCVATAVVVGFMFRDTSRDSRAMVLFWSNATIRAALVCLRVAFVVLATLFFACAAALRLFGRLLLLLRDFLC